MQEIWDTMKRPSLFIISIQEREESQVNGNDQIFNMITEKKNLP